MGETLELAGVVREAGVVERVMEGTVYRLAGGGGHWLSKKHKRARDP